MKKKSAIDSFNKAKRDIINLSKKINQPLNKNTLELQSFKKKINVFRNVQSNTNYQDFKEMVEKAKKLIFEGEIFKLFFLEFLKKN